MRAAVARGNSRPWRDGSVEALVAAARRAVEVRAHVRAREAGAKNVRKWDRLRGCLLLFREVDTLPLEHMQQRLGALHDLP